MIILFDKYTKHIELFKQMNREGISASTFVFYSDVYLKFDMFKKEYGYTTAITLTSDFCKISERRVKKILSLLKKEV